MINLLRPHLIVLSSISIIFGLILSEFYLSSLDLPKFLKPPLKTLQFQIHKKMNDGDLVYYNVPSKTFSIFYASNPRKYFGKINQVDHANNSWGFRGPEFDLDNKPSFKVAFIGDSFTFGEGVWFKDTFPEKVSSQLNNRIKKNSYFESYNFGVGGHNTKQTMYVLKNEALKIKPEIVVLGYHINDLEPSLLKLSNKSNLIGEIPRKKIIYGKWADGIPPDRGLFNLRIFRLIWKFVRDKKISQKTIKFYKSLYENESNLISLKKNFKSFKKICSENEIKCFVMTFPIFFKLESDYPFSKIHDLVNKVGSEVGLTTIDLLKNFKGKRSDQFWVHSTDHHPNEKANQIVSDTLVKVFLETGVEGNLIP